jgi:hypothetical protein
MRLVHRPIPGSRAAVTNRNPETKREPPNWRTAIGLRFRLPRSPDPAVWDLQFRQAGIYARFVPKGSIWPTEADMGIWHRGRLRHSVGLETKGDRFTPVIAKGRRLPVSRTEIFTTADPNQSSIQFRVFQGEKSQASLNEELGSFELAEIPPADPGEPQIEVTFHVDAQGTFSITARDAGTGRDVPVLRR